ncbi:MULTISPECIES: cation:proton antiporter [Halorubrum]|jgi:multicomponent Na+:H+ antiporter subunit F|uniref:Monovalent cation/H+ antiporter subunit F n=10 Tax=Halorubrum TaxID=56688 RepID=M0EIQ1_9EURY|nr:MULTISPECIES: cation:proton antiporter [Halorubrum]OYR95507.1 cation:proton antiporter [Halorubrum sp. E3]PHQ47260.1 cation:proton antiporter [Halorubrum sp. C3]ELZ27908.1 monovalent cation/H+ antiporter subunit F [Halorubrum terrestre JCM 10247]ELZ40085.1 monovalent cation/H+ antiporter subunit F [Halorubrum californiense DSM 19288]ELZ47651.1 monovalent cation/H+ antiporter subunit F [Halorubrum distributum JCM 9100]
MSLVDASLAAGYTLGDFLLVAAAGFAVLAVGMLYRAVVGPTMQDRVLAVNVLGTNTVVILAILGAALGEPTFLDIALVYALLNFLMAIAISKFTVERGGVL